MRTSYRRSNMTKTLLKIVGIGCSPKCDTCRPIEEHPYLRGEVMTVVPPPAIRLMDGDTIQLCLPCFQARFLEAYLNPIRKMIDSDPMFKFGIKAIDMMIDV